MYPKIHISYVFPLAFKRHYASDVLNITFLFCINDENIFPKCEKYLKNLTWGFCNVIMFYKMQFLTKGKHN